MKRDTKLETSLSKAIAKISMAQKEMYSNTPFALRLLLEADKDMERSKTTLRGMLGRQQKNEKNINHNVWIYDTSICRHK